jgi:predicted nucleic acid-binding protein
MTPDDALPSLGEQSLTRPPRIVIDTNAALDWLLFADPAAQALGQAVEAGRVAWIGTAAMRDELAHVLASGLAAQRARAPAPVLAAWHRHCAMLPVPAAAPWRCSDADDQPFVDLALASGARWLVSRDKALLKLARRARTRGLSIVTPGHWALT